MRYSTGTADQVSHACCRPVSSRQRSCTPLRLSPCSQGPLRMRATLSHVIYLTIVYRHCPTFNRGTAEEYHTKSGHRAVNPANYDHWRQTSRSRKEKSSVGDWCWCWAVVVPCGFGRAVGCLSGGPKIWLETLQIQDTNNTFSMRKGEQNQRSL